MKYINTAQRPLTKLLQEALSVFFVYNPVYKTKKAIAMLSWNKVRQLSGLYCLWNMKTSHSMGNDPTKSIQRLFEY